MKDMIKGFLAALVLVWFVLLPAELQLISLITDHPQQAMCYIFVNGRWIKIC